MINLFSFQIRMVMSSIIKWQLLWKCPNFWNLRLDMKDMEEAIEFETKETVTFYPLNYRTRGPNELT